MPRHSLPIKVVPAANSPDAPARRSPEEHRHSQSAHDAHDHRHAQDPVHDHADDSAQPHVHEHVHANDHQHGDGHHHGDDHSHGHNHGQPPRPAAPGGAASQTASPAVHAHACGHDHDGHDHGGAHAVPQATAKSKKIPAAPLPPGAVSSKRLISQMDCPTEEALLRQKLGGMSQVHALDFNLIQRVLTVVHTPDALDAIDNAIREVGMTPQDLDEPGEHVPPAPDKFAHWRLIGAGVAAVAAEAAHWWDAPRAVPAVLALICIALSGLTTYKKGWISIRHLNLNINALMSIAVTGALLLGQWPEAAMVMFLFAVSELIEARSLGRARRAIGDLVGQAPQVITVRQADGQWEEVAAADATVGAIARVRPGERVALDGEIVAGRATLDEAPITGESLPVEKEIGARVFAGTINGSGSFEYRVTAISTDTTLARIVHAVEEAQGVRAPMQRWVDQFARYYTPAVVLLAVAIAVLPPLLAQASWQEWVYKALVLLVIACPCALVISTPVTVVSGLAQAARNGILIKGGVFLEQGRKLRWLALDKTGTLTQGRPAQTDFVVADGETQARIHALAVSVAARSDHPVSVAVAQAGKAQGVVAEDVEEFAAVPGRGVQALVQGELVQLGNRRFMSESNVVLGSLEAPLAALEAEGKTVLVASAQGRAVGLFAVADAIRSTSREAIDRLKQLGVTCFVLSGDHPAATESVGRAMGIEARGGLLPQDKTQAIESRLSQGGLVGMVGDGINDAPALARADIGFAMGAAGTDTAIETADVALMDDDLRKVSQFVELSRRTHTILVQNVTVALGLKVVFLALTLLGLGTLWMAVFADVGASLLVVANGLRLMRPSRSNASPMRPAAAQPAMPS